MSITKIIRNCTFTALAISATSLATSTSANASMEPFIGEVKAVGFGFCPRGWAPAEGQILPIVENQSLFSLYGTMYGGDGRTTFALPDLRGKSIISVSSEEGASFRQGQTAGEKAEGKSYGEAKDAQFLTLKWCVALRGIFPSRN